MKRRNEEKEGTHRLPASKPKHIAGIERGEESLSQDGVYGSNDLKALQDTAVPKMSYFYTLSSIDELLERDKQREEDGFPRKIRLGRLVKPGRSDKGKVIVVPTTVEEKFIHDMSPEDPGRPSPTGGSGQGEEGDVIGEEPIHGSEGAGKAGAGHGEGGEHEIESSAYELGRILTEKFQLPNLKDKGKRASITKYTYDLLDRNEGAGQLLDKKATLRKIVETNISLGYISDTEDIDPSRLLVSPDKMVYRILSREKEYESQAVVFFLRDYSGSMDGRPTEIVVSQHVMIYSWLLYQYEKQVETRFILHDTEAKEVPDFFTYYNSTVAGGTKVQAAYRLVNEIVEAGNLARDYNIYVFHGTDGEDWDSDGAATVTEIKKILSYASRVGITIARRASEEAGGTVVENYLKKSRLLEEHPKEIKMDSIAEGADETRLIEGIRALIS